MASQKVHTAVGLSIWAFIWLIFQPRPELGAAMFLVIVLGSILPDADLMFKPLLKHRGLSHTLRAAFLYAVLCVLAGSVVLFPEELAVIGLLSLISYSTHLLFDSHIKF
ncbi:metal-dependent hydrolase [archaeon]|nr:metal-dependent hydrolase [archaeon]